MSIQAMITTIRNNNLMRSERLKFKRSSGVGYIVKPTYDFPKASHKQLSSIRRRLKRERAHRMIKVVTLSIVIFLCLLLVVQYVLKYLF